jgi:DNA (cytosine-5)-methyltransferase 1
MNELHLFAGAGGGILGGHLLGHTTVCAVEIEPYCRRVLLQRQRDGILPKFPIWDDVTTFDGTPWRGKVDVVCGGFPCQDISSAGKGAGIAGERSGLWKEMARIIGEVQSRFVFIENSPMLRTRGLSTVLKDLAEMGYDARWGIISATDTGAPHQRKRMWILAYPNSIRSEEYSSNSKLWSDWTEQSPKDSGVAYERENAEIKKAGNANSSHFKRVWISSGIHSQNTFTNKSSSWWEADPADAIESRVGRVANGVASRVDRLKAIGNGQVPIVAATAFRLLSESITK